MNVKLYVGNIAPGTTAQDLRALFSRHGPVTSIRLQDDNDGAESKTFAHVTMATPVAAQRALDRIHNTDLKGSRLAVSFAQTRGRVAGDQGRLSAFGPITSRAASPSRRPPVRGTMQSSLSAFGGGKSAPTPPRRRGGSQRR